ncbi:MAG: hypothetical protein NTY68_03100 [Candidatus Micrarchaeota archaeon]|nr:hypothetical protein [Candidatus Micrarchaeota archaeon]
MGDEALAQKAPKKTKHGPREPAQKISAAKLSDFETARILLRDNGYSFVGFLRWNGPIIMEFQVPNSSQTVGIQKNSSGLTLITDFGSKKESMEAGEPIYGFFVKASDTSSFKEEFLKLARSQKLPLPKEAEVIPKTAVPRKKPKASSRK